MAFVSFAPNREDVILWRALEHVGGGRYVDIGAGDCDERSVTRAFSERGWRGINVAASPAAHEVLKQFRPLDAAVLLSDPAASLRELWNVHAGTVVHFLHVAAPDPELHLAALDLARQRPWVVVVNVAEDDGRGARPACEAVLAGAGYAFARRAGASRFWVAKEHEDVLAAIAGADGCDDAQSETAVAGAEDAKLYRKQRDRLLSIVAEGSGGFDARRHPHLVPYLAGRLPTLDAPVSQMCTQSQLDEPLYRRWCNLLRERPCAHRKQWEFVYIMQTLWTRGMLAPGRRGLGFGCGNEPLASAMAAYGCEVVATDLDPEDQRSKDWRDTDQHAAGKIEALNARSICPPDLFAERVRYRNVDMNRIPEDLRGFDFVWSSCALEHIGSIRHGLDFIHEAMKCLKPGGTAVHTTEFNLTSNETTLESPGLSFFRAYDLEKVAAELTLRGHEVAPFNLHPGDTLLDRYVDLPPFEVSALHLRLRTLDHTLTSVGLVARKGRTEDAPQREPTEAEGEAHERTLEPLVARMETDPHDVRNFLELARLLDGMGDAARARQCLEVALDQNPKDERLWQALVDQSRDRCDPAGAAADARDALGQLPSGGAGEWHLAAARASLVSGAHDEARATLDAGVAAFPSHARLAQLRAALPRFPKPA